MKYLKKEHNILFHSAIKAKLYLFIYLLLARHDLGKYFPYEGSGDCPICL